MISSLQSLERSNRSFRSRGAHVASAPVAAGCFIDVAKLVGLCDRPRTASISLQPQTPITQRHHYEAALLRRPLVSINHTSLEA